MTNRLCHGNLQKPANVKLGIFNYYQVFLIVIIASLIRTMVDKFNFSELAHRENIEY